MNTHDTPPLPHELYATRGGGGVSLFHDGAMRWLRAEFAVLRARSL